MGDTTSVMIIIAGVSLSKQHTNLLLHKAGFVYVATLTVAVLAVGLYDLTRYLLVHYKCMN